MEKTSSKKQFRTMAAFAAAGFVVFGLIAGGMYLSRSAPETRRQSSPELVVFTGIPDNTAVQASLQNQNGVTELAVENGRVLLPETLQQNFLLPYKLSVKMENDKGKFYDLVWTLDKNGIEYDVLFDGLSPKEKIDVVLDGSTSTGEYYTDWSGRFLLQVLLNIHEDMTVCAKVLSKTPFGFCQTVPANPEAV